MPTVVGVHEAKTHLSRLVEAVEAGEDPVIARTGRRSLGWCRPLPGRCTADPGRPGVAGAAA